MRIRTKGLLVIAAAFSILAGCVTSGERVVADGRPFILTAGEQATFADGTVLAFWRVIDDSRCRPDVRCIWAGRADVELQVTPPPRADGAVSAASELLLSADKQPSASYAGRRYQLLKLGYEASPEATLRADPDLNRR